MPLLDVFIDQRVEEVVIPAENKIQLWAQAAYLEDSKTTVSISIVDEVESRSLNWRYREKDSATNVLSFPMDLPAEVPDSMLGDLILCAAIIEQEAREQHKTLDAHWAHMVVHGMLHLQGYDHIQEAAAMQMEALERDILADLGIADPYTIP